MGAVGAVALERNNLRKMRRQLGEPADLSPSSTAQELSLESKYDCRSNAIWAQRNGTYEDASLEGRVRRLLAL